MDNSSWFYIIVGILIIVLLLFLPKFAEWKINRDIEKEIDEIENDPQR